MADLREIKPVATANREHIIKELEELLEQVRAGEVAMVAGAVLGANRIVTTFVAGGATLLELVGALELAKSDIIQTAKTRP